MKTFVITYNERYRGKDVFNKVLWNGDNYEDALQTFYLSFDEFDRKKLSGVRIFSLVEYLGDTSFKG